MKAARLEDGTLHIRDIPVPVPGDEEALVRISASGVCHSDLHLARGDWLGVPRSGSIGHEAIGVVEALGPGAERFVAGRRPRDPRARRHGRRLLVRRVRVLPARAAAPLPRRPSASWAPSPSTSACGRRSLVQLPDAGRRRGGAARVRRPHRVRRGEEAARSTTSSPGRPIAVIGAAGGLGHYAVQIAHAFGYRVVGVDIGEERLEFVAVARRRRRGRAPTTPSTSCSASSAASTPCLVFSARIAGFELGLKMLRARRPVRRRRAPADRARATSSSTRSSSSSPIPTIIYSAVGTVQDMRELVDLAAAGRVKSHVSRVGALSELADDLRRARSGQVPRSRRHHRPAAAVSDAAGWTAHAARCASRSSAPGPGGLCMGKRLLDEGFDDFVLLEQSDGVGGTWNRNRYPGCECDVPSALYSFSFEFKPDWSKPYGTQPEILEYMQRHRREVRAAPALPVRRRCRRGRVGRARPRRGRSRSSRATRSTPTSSSARSACSTTCAWPDIDGLDSFARHDVPLGATGTGITTSPASASRSSAARRARCSSCPRS